MTVEGVAITATQGMGFSLSTYLTQMLKEWDKISLQNGILGSLCPETGSELEAFQVLVPCNETSEVWESYHLGMGHRSYEQSLSSSSPPDDIFGQE